MRDGYILPLAFLFTVAASLRRSDAQTGIITPWNDTVKIENAFYTDREKYDSAMSVYTASLEEIRESCERYEEVCEAITKAPEKHGMSTPGCEGEKYIKRPIPYISPISYISLEPDVVPEPKIERKYCEKDLRYAGIRCSDWGTYNELMKKRVRFFYKGNRRTIGNPEAEIGYMELNEYNQEFLVNIGEIFEEYEELYGARPSHIIYTGWMTEDGFYWFRPVFEDRPPIPEVEEVIERPCDVSEEMVSLFLPRELAASSIDGGSDIGVIGVNGGSYENMKRLKYIKWDDIESYSTAVFLGKDEFCGMNEKMQDMVVPNPEAYREALCGRDGPNGKKFAGGYAPVPPSVDGLVLEEIDATDVTAAE